MTREDRLGALEKLTREASQNADPADLESYDRAYARWGRVFVALCDEMTHS